MNSSCLLKEDGCLAKSCDQIGKQYLPLGWETLAKDSVSLCCDLGDKKELELLAHLYR
jgi:hypothetical protein